MALWFEAFECFKVLRISAGFNIHLYFFAKQSNLNFSRLV